MNKKSRSNRCTYFVVPAWNCQDVSSDGPAHVPHNIIEFVEEFGRPGVARRVVARPYKHSPIL